MLTFFYSLSLLFVWVEWIQFRKKAIIYSKDFLKVNNFQLFLFFISKILNMISIPIGFFTPLKLFYFILATIEINKFFLLWTKNNLFINWYNLISVFIYIIIYIWIFIQGVLL
jgi:hypothetical protein